MGWFTGIVVFLLTWWVVIFMVLPWGLKRDADGTPKDPRLIFKIILTTVISVLFWLIIYALIEADVISFRDMARTMSEQERAL